MVILKRIWTSLQHVVSDRRGSTVTFLAAAAVPLVAFSALSIDTARGYLTKQRLGYAIEAAALASAKAGVNATDAEIEAAGRRIFDANFPAGYMGGITPNIEFSISPNKREITITGSANMPTALMGVVGIDDVSVGAAATAQRQSKGLELAIALDNTGSMGCCIDDLKDAAHLLLDTLYGESETVENLWVSLLPFDSRVNLSNYRSSIFSFPVSWSSRHYVCANARTTSPYTIDDTPPDVTQPSTLFTSRFNLSSGCEATKALALTAEKSTLDDKIDAMSANGNTRIDEAAAWAFRMLSPKWRGLWGNPSLPLDYNTALMDKAAIIMSDGKNEPRWDDEANAATANTRLSDICTAMKANNIIVYTIQYKDGTESVQNLMRNCATSPSHYFFAEEDDLSGVFNEIANQLSNLRLLNVK